MLVSIIIPVHNRAELLREAVSSALAQTHRPMEILIVDDGSTDDTRGVAESLALAHPDTIRLLAHEQNRGVGAARETARGALRGDFIQHLDSDDWIAPGKVEACVRALQSSPHCGIAYCTTGHRGPDRSLDPIPWKDTAQDRPSLFPWLLNRRWWASHSPLFRRDCYMAAGPFKDYRIEEDWEFEGRLGAARVQLVHVPEMLAEVRDHGGTRLGRNRSLPGPLLASRAHAHADLLASARRAGMEPDCAAMREYAREMFLIARQCARLGLDQECERCLIAARDAAPGERGLAAQLLAFRSARAILGSQLAGGLSAEVLDPGRNLVRRVVGERRKASP